MRPNVNGSRFGWFKSYKFEVGNSSSGPLGMVIRVAARSEEEALKIANDQLRFMGEIEIDEDGSSAHGVEYCHIYTASNLTLEDLVRDETEDVEFEEIPQYSQVLTEMYAEEDAELEAEKANAKSHTE